MQIPTVIDVSSAYIWKSSEINMLQNFQELHAMNLEMSLKLEGYCYSHNTWSTSAYQNHSLSNRSIKHSRKNSDLFKLDSPGVFEDTKEGARISEKSMSQSLTLTTKYFV